MNQMLIGILSACAVFMMVLFVSAAQFAAVPLNRKMGRTWLFENWQSDLYDAITSKNPLDVSKKLKIDAEQYLLYMQLMQRQPNLKRLIMHKILSLFLILCGILLLFFFGSPMLLALCLVIAFFLSTHETSKLKQDVAKRKIQMESELPRFLDLLHTALLIGVPVDQAIQITARALPETILAQEFLLSLAETEIGSCNWQQSLERMAQNYAIDTLSDFVLDLTNSYRNGTSIVASVERKSEEIKKCHLVSMKERASKLTSTILMPVAVFKIIPLLMLLCVPILQQLNNFDIGF